jgi:hypothetical protein
VVHERAPLPDHVTAVVTTRNCQPRRALPRAGPGRASGVPSSGGPVRAARLWQEREDGRKR